MADSSSAPKGKPAAGGFSLTSKIGPFPVWAYMAVIVVGLYMYEKKKKASTTTTAAPATAANGQAGGFGSASSGTAGSIGTGVAGPGNDIESLLNANAGQPTTNPQWEANAEAILVGYGYPYTQVQSALNQYLSGGVLSSVQQEIVNAAIEAAGPPPSAPTTQSASTNSPTTATPAVATPVAPSYMQGSGFTAGNPAVVTGQNGSSYAPLASPSQIPAGAQTFYEVDPGVFEAVTPGTQLAPNTPQYLQVS